MQQTSLCPKCGAQNPPSQGFCSGCGVQLQQNCPNCNSLVDVAARFCSTCGAGLGWGMRVKDLQYQLTMAESGLKGLVAQTATELQGQLKHTEDGVKAVMGQQSDNILAQQVTLNETARRITNLIAEEHSMSLGRKLNRIGSGIIALGLAAIGLSYVWNDIPYLAIGGAIIVAVGFLLQLISNFISARIV
jgi:hypothetical protein